MRTRQVVQILPGFCSTAPAALPLTRGARIGDQERGSVAADLKRAMREKAKEGIRTFTLTADVAEAQRPIPMARCDWQPQVEVGTFLYRWYVRSRVRIVRLVASLVSPRRVVTVSG